MEALFCGVPCVGFRVGGIPEMIDHLRNGYLAEARNADDLAEGIRFCLDPERRDTLSGHAVHTALSRYGETHVASKYIAIYQRISGKR